MFPSEFKYKILPLRDIAEEDIYKYLDESVDFMDEVLRANGKVYVHCMAGRSRSATIVAAWLIKKKGCSHSCFVRHIFVQKESLFFFVSTITK